VYEVSNAGHLTDYKALQIALKALRLVRTSYRASDTAGEKFEREVDRLIKRKTRINAGSLKTLEAAYKAYADQVGRMQEFLTYAYGTISNF